MRFRAKLSPNIIAGIDYYPYLMRNERYKFYCTYYGENSGTYLSMVDAWFSASAFGNSVLQQADIAGGGALENEVLENKESFCFIDPAFTYDGDGLLAVELGYGYSKGEDKEKISCDDIRRLELEPDLVWTPELVALAKHFRKGQPIKPSVEVGQPMTGEENATLRIGEYCEERGIPLDNLGYDESMMGTFVHEMHYFLGAGPTPYRYGGKPDKRQAFPIQWKSTYVNGRSGRTPKHNDECHDKMVSQMWFTSANLIRNGYICNGMTASRFGRPVSFYDAFNEMKKRAKDPKSTKKRKEDVETKGEYKSRNKNLSPDAADAFCGGCNMIVERRFMPQRQSSDASQSGDIAALERLLEGYEDSDGFYVEAPRRENLIPTLGR